MTITASAAAALNVSAITTPVAVADTASAVVTYLGSLQNIAAASKLASIALTNTGTPTLSLTAAQLVADAAALLKIGGSYAITVTGNATAAQAAAVNATLAGLLTSGLTVADSAANVTASLAGLQIQAAAGKLASITLTDTGTPSLTLTAAVLVADAAALLKIGGSYAITASGAATAAQAAAINSTLAAKISNGLVVSDTAANVAANLASLQTRAAAGKLTSITLTDGGTPTLTMTAAVLLADATALLKIGGSYAITVSGTATASQASSVNSTLVTKLAGGLAVSDTAANVNGNLGGLETLAAAGKLASITLTDNGTPTLRMTAAQVIYCIPMLQKISSNYALAVTTSATAAQAVAFTSQLLAKLTSSLTVTDAAANIAPRLNGLQSLYAAGKLASVSVSGTTPLSVSAATLVADKGVLSAIQGPYTLAVTSGTLTVAQAVGLSGSVAANVANGLALGDSAANVAAGIDALQAQAGVIGSIALTDGGTPTLTIAPQQLGNDANILLKIVGNFVIALSGAVTAAQAVTANSTLLAKMTTGLAISDSAANVTTNIDALQGLGGTVASIALTDSGTPALSLTVAQLAADAATLLEITSPFSLTLSGPLSVAQAQTAQVEGLLASVTGGAAISDTAANVQAALGSLPGLVSAISSITLTDSSTPTLSVSAATLVADAGALALIGGSWTLAVTGSVTAAQTLALGSAITTHLATGLTVSDSAAAVASHLDALQTLGGVVASIALTDGNTPALSLTATQLVADAATLLKISGSYAITVSAATTAAQATAVNATLASKLTSGLAVSDTVAAVASHLDALQTLGGAVGSIALTDGNASALSLTAAQLVSDAATLLKIGSSYALTLSAAATATQATTANSTLVGKLTSGFAVSDTTSNVTTSLGGLQSLATAGKLASITLTDGSPTLSVSATTLIADAGVLALIGGSWSLIVASGTVTAAQAVALSTAVTSHLTSGGLSLSDSAANVAATLDPLQTLGGVVGSIALTDGGTPALSLTAAQLVADAATLLKISGSYALTLSAAATATQATTANNTLVGKLTSGFAVSDTASNVTASLGGLQGLAAVSKLASITLTDSSAPTLSVSASTLVADAGALALIGGSWTLAVTGSVTAAQATGLANAVTSHLATGLAGLTVSDSAAAVASHLDALQTLGGAVASIALTDGNTPALSLTAAQLVADAATLLKISGSYAITVSAAATAAQAAAANATLAGKLTSGLAVSDTASNVTASLGGLQSLAAASKLASITLTDSSTPTLTISAATLMADLAALGAISSGYNLSITSGTLSTAQVVTLNAAPAVVSHLTASIAVSDSAASVVAHIADLAALGMPLASITLSDTGGVPVLTLAPAQLIADATTLLKIGGSYAITVSAAATAAQALAANSTLAGMLTSGMVVSDSAAAVASHLDALQTLGGTVASITLTDTGNTPALSLTAAQLVADAATLLKIGGSYALTLSAAATATQATTANATLVGKLTSGFAVSDTASNVTASLGGLQSLAAASKLASVTLTDSSTPTLTISAATLVADAGALALIGGSWTLAVTGSVTAAQALALGSAITAHLATGLTVSDSVAAVASHLDALQTLGGAVASITLTDGNTPALSLTASQLVADAATLLKISGSYALTLSAAATATQATTANSTLVGKLTSGFAVSDTASNVTASLSGLQSLAAASKLASITLTDSSTPTLSVSATTLMADLAALGAISSGYNLSISSGMFTVTQALALNSTVIAHLAAGVAVADSAANVAAHLGGLQALGSTVGTVALTDNPPNFAVTADQLWHDAGILGKVIAGGVPLVADSGNTASAAAAANLAGAPAYTGTLRFADTAASIAGALDSLQALATASHLGAVSLTDGGIPTLSVTATQLSTDAGALAMISGSYALSVTTGTLTAAQALAVSNTLLPHLAAALPVRDSSANIVTSLDALQARAAAIATVSFSDGTPTLSLTAAQVTGDIGVLSLATGYNLSVSGTLTAAQAATISPTSVIAHLITGPVISDTAANISGNLASLMVLANANKLGSISLTDSGTPTLSVTPAQLSGDVAVLRKINSNYTLTPTTTLTADQAAGISSLLVGKLPSSLAVSDTAANVVADLDGLEVLVAGNHLGTVNLTDTSTPVLQITADQVTSDAPVLAEITGNYQVNITGGITVAQAATYASNTAKLATSVHVVDAASAVAGGIASLQALAAAGLLSSIAFTNSGTPNLTLTASAFAASAAALGTIVGTYTISLTGTLTVTQTQAAATAGLLAFIPAHAPVGDTAAHVQAALDALKTLGSNVASIALTDGGTPTVTVSAATLLADTSVLALIGGNWHLAVSPGTLTVAQATGLSSTVTSRLSSGLALSDTAASVAGAIDALQALETAVASIALTDTSPVLSITAARFLADATTLLKIGGPYGITVTGTVTAAQAVGASNTLVGKLTAGLAVADTAANVTTSLTGLQGLAAASKLASVMLTDSGVPTLPMNTATLTANASALALIGGTWHLSVTGNVTAAQAIALGAAVTAHLSAGLALSDSAANIVSALDALQGLGVAVASIALTDGSTPALALTAGTLVSDAATLLKIISPYQVTLSGSLTVAQATQAPTTGLLALVSGGVSVRDTAAAVQAALDALQGLGNQVTGLTLSDSGIPTLSVTAAKMVADAATLGKISGQYHLSVSSGTVSVAQATAFSGTVTGHLASGLAVSDTAAAVAGSIDALQTLGTAVASIALSDGGTLPLSAAQLVADAAALLKIGGSYGITLSGALTVAQAQSAATQGLLARVTGGVAISDTAGNVQGGLDALQTLGGGIASIALTGGGTPALSLTATQLVADQATLLKVAAPFSITLAPGGTLSVTQAQAAQTQGLLTRVTGGVAVNDTAANIQAALGALLGLGNEVASVTLTDASTPTISIIASALVADAAVLAKININSAYHLTVTSGSVTAAQATALSTGVTAHLTGGLGVSDSSGNVNVNLDALQAIIGTIGSITLTDGSPTLSVSATTLIADAGVLALIGGSWSLIVASGIVTAAQAVALSTAVTSHLTSSGLSLSDSAANVAATLDPLQTLGGVVGSIALTDGGTPALSLTASQLVADAATLLKIGGSYALTLSAAATAAQATTANNTLVGKLTSGFAVSDTASNVTASLGGLQGLATASKLASVTLTDSSAPTLSVSAATLVADAGALALIGGSWTLAVTGSVTAAQATGLANAVTTHLATGLAGLTVSDSAAAVASHLDALQTLGGAVASITLTDSSTPALSLTAAQLVADAATLLKIGGSYAITVSAAATATQAAAVNATLAGKLTSGLAVSDTASNVTTSLGGLQSLAAASKLASITLTDSSTPTLTISAATLVADAGALALIGGNWTLAVTGSVTAAQATGLASLVTSHLATGLAVSDTAAAITASLVGLQALGNTVASIGLSDTGGVPVLTLTPAQMIANATALQKINSPCNISVSGAATAAQAAGVAPALAGKILAGFVVSDTASNVTANLDGLQTRNAATELASITLSDSSTPTLSVSASTLAADAATLALISGAWTLTVNGSVTATQATTANSTLVGKLTSGFAVSDTASNVTASLGGLQSLAAASKLASITLTDSSTPTLSVSAATLVADAGALALISSAWTLAVTGSVTAAQATGLASPVTSHLATGLAVSDTAAAITASLVGLQALGNTVASIGLSDTGGVPVLTLTPAQMIANATALQKINSPCNISVSGAATAAQAAGVAPALAGKILAGFVVSDTASNVIANLNGLQTRNAATELASINLTDSSTPTLSVSASTLVADAGTLALISGSWHLSISSGTFTVTQALALNSTVIAHLAAGVAVADSAANVAAHLGGLQALGSTVGTVALTDNPPNFAVTADQLWHDAGILGKVIAGGVPLVADSGNTASAAAAANLAGAPAYTGTLRFADTAASIAGALDSLQALATAGHLGAVSLTDGGIPTLSVTATQLNNDAGALAMISGNYALSVTTGTLTAAQALAISNTLLTHLTAAVPVRDTSTNIVTSLTALQARVAAIASVAFSNGTPTLSLTPTQLTGGIGVLGLASGYNLSVSGTLTAAQAATLSPTSVVSHLTTGPVISDTAANISGNLASLMVLANASKLGSISLTDSGTPTLSVTPAQLSGDVGVLRKISGNYTLTPTTSLTADQATNVNTLLVSKLSSSLTVSDTAANVFNDLDALEVLVRNNHLQSVTLTDTGIPVLQVTGDQLTTDADVLAEIGGTHQFNIMGGVTAVQAAFYANHPNNLADALDVVDAASAVASNMTSLQTLAAAGKLDSIAFTDTGTPSMTLTGSVFANSATALGAIVGTYSVTLSSPLSVTQIQAAQTAGLLDFVSGGAAISDTASNVQAALGALKALGNNVASITLTDNPGTPTVTVTAATLLADTSVLALITTNTWNLAVSPDTLTVAQATGLTNGIVSHLNPGLALSDSVANVLGSLAALQTMGPAIASIALTDTTPVLTLSNTQLVNDGTTLAKVAAPFSITLNGALSVSQAGTAATQGLLAKVTGGVAINDTASAVQNALDTLQGYGGKVASVTLSDSTTPTINVSPTTLANDAGVLGRIGGTWNLNVQDNVTAAVATGLAPAVTTHLSPGLTISDSASQVAGNIDALQTLAGKVASIALTDTTPVLSLTKTQFVNDATTLQKISTAFTINLTGTLSVAQAQAAQNQMVQGQSLLSLVNNGAAISDSATTVQGVLSTLLGLGSGVASIALNDSTTPTISVTPGDLVTYAPVLAKVTISPYHLTVSPGTVTAAQATALNTGVTSHLTGGLAVLDSADNVKGSLDALQGMLSKLATINLTDNVSPTPMISITDATMVADAGVLALIGGTWQLTASSTIGAADAVALSGTVTGRLSGGLTVSDSSTNVAANLNALQDRGTAIQHITLTDNSPVLSITAAQLVADSAVLLKITSPSYSITLSGPAATAAQAAMADSTLVGYLTSGLVVSDTASAVTTNLTGLQTRAAAGKLASITLTDGTTPPPTISLDAGTLLADAGALALIGGAWNLTASSGSIGAAAAVGLVSAVTSHLTGGVAVSDSATNVSGQLDNLQAAGSAIASIALSGGGGTTLTMNATQLISDSAALLKVSAPFSISVSGNTTAAQAAAINATLRGYLIASSLAVSGLASAVTTNLDGLQTLVTAGKLASITLTDSPKPTLTIAATTLVNDSGALALMGSQYNLTVTGNVTAAQAVALSSTVTANLTPGAGLTVSDTAADVAGAIDNLQTLGGVVQSIGLSDSPATLTLTPTQFLSDATTLGKINTTYTVTLSGPLAVADAATADGNSLLAKVFGGAAINDTALAVQNALDALQGYGSHVASIALSDNTTPTITVDPATLVSDNAALGKISSAYSLAVNSGNLTAAQAGGLRSSVNSHLSDNVLTVSDTGAAVAANIDALQANYSSLASITLTDGSTPALSITAAQLVADAATLQLIAASSSFTITLSGTLTEAQAATADTQGLLTLVTNGAAISDTAAHVQGSLGTLQGLGSKVASIALTDNTTPTITISSATLVADAAALGKVSNGYHLTIGSDTVTAAQATGITAPLVTYLTNGFTVSDTAANVASSIAGLQTLAAGNHVASIAVTDSSNPVTLTATNVTADLSALTAITGSWQLAVSTGTFTAAQAATLVTDGLGADLTGTINVTDTASHMMANLGALEQLSSHLGTITLSTSPPAFNVTVTQAAADVAAINAIMGATNANSSEVLYVNGTNSGDTVNTSLISHAVNISLGGNNATMSFSGSVGTVSGTADSATVGNAAGARLENTLSSGTEVITGFHVGRDILDLALNNADPSTLTVTDVMVNATAAIALAVSGDPTHGVILMTPGINATTLQDDHLFAAGSHVLIS